MSKKDLEAIELNKKEEKIILAEKQSPLIVFWHKHRYLISILLILALLLLITGSFIFFKNIYQSKDPIINKATLDSSLTDLNNTITGGQVPITEETAKNKFLNSGAFKNSGEVLTVKVIESGTFIIKFYSDGTALKIIKKGNLITRINPLENGDYGIDNQGVINTKATTKDITLINTKTYPWGTVSYFSDGSAEITDSKINMFVRNSNDINDNYISNNKVSYLKETKSIGNNKLNYYYDGTIEIIKDNQSYLVRNEKDLQINNQDIIFNNNNAAKIYQTKTMDDGIVIDYYEDGGAIIRDGTRTISVRKSNSIIIYNNKIYEIVDNIYVEISKTTNQGDIIYYTNGGAVYKDQNKTYYIDENSHIKYQNGQISTVEGNPENLTKTTNIEDELVQIFEKTAVVKTKDYLAIVPKDGILYDKDGTIKEINTDDLGNEDNQFTITNNSNERLKYRIVIEKSERTNLDTQYLRYQMQIKEKYSGIKKLDDNIWEPDSISKELGLSGTNYILVDDIIEPYDTINFKFMIWTDYETIPNSMQNKYFYGTIKIYAWTEIKK